MKGGREMKKTDKQTLDMLREEFAKSTETAQVPLRLQKDSVVTMLKNSDAKTKDFSSKTGHKRNSTVIFRRVAMAAAVFAVVIVAAVYAANQGGVGVIKTDSFYKSYNKVEPVKSAKSYAEIEKAVQEIRNIKSALSGGQETDAANTLASTKPQEQAIVGGYNEYVAKETSGEENKGPGADVLLDPNPGSNSGGSINADIIKDDGEYIYIVTNENDSKTGKLVEQIKIIKADPAEEMQTVPPIILSDGNKTDYTDNCLEIYIKDNKLIVLMERKSHQSKSAGLYNKKSTVVITYDITDQTAPVEIRRHVQDGEYITSGLYGNNLRLITKKSIPEFSQNADIDLNSVIPSFSVNGKETQLNAKELFIAVNDPDASYLFITVTDISDPNAESGRLAILGCGKDIYNLQDAIVVARGFVSVEADKNGAYGSLTEICRFNISGTSIGFVASYVTEGSLISGNSIDEHGGYLRVATKKDGAANLYIFSDKMEFICCITAAKFLEGKDVNRVKFIGNRAYFIIETDSGEEVWFIDISDPKKPVEGAKLPTEGFIQMLSPVSDDAVLVITEYPDDKNWFTGKKGKYSICSVSDAKNPVIISEYELGEGYSYPMGTDQRHAMLDTERKLFASPVRYADVSSGEISSIYLVFDISENKFNLIGLYEHSGEDGVVADRCIMIGDSFYTVSGMSITAFSTEEQKVVSSVAIR